MAIEGRTGDRGSHQPAWLHHEWRCIPLAVVHDRVGEHPRVDHLAEPSQLAEAVPGQLVI